MPEIAFIPQEVAKIFIFNTYDIFMEPTALWPTQSDFWMGRDPSGFPYGASTHTAQSSANKDRSRIRTRPMLDAIELRLASRMDCKKRHVARHYGGGAEAQLTMLIRSDD